MKKRYVIALIITGLILYLSHHFWMGTKAHPNFDLMLFIIVLVLGYLLSLKVASYLADLKTVKGKSRIEIIFLVLFFIILFVPMCSINKDIYSKQENRTLTKWQPLITKKNKINFNFGKDFDSWFSDRFFTRNFVISNYSLLRYNMAEIYYENKMGFINKKNNWISTKYAIGNPTIKQKDRDLTVYNIEKLKEFCNEKGIKFYIIIAPRKQEICHKYLYPILFNPSAYSSTRKMIEYVKEKTGVEIVYPYKELEKLQNRDIAYFKTDHHWTDEGAYLGYLQVMEQVKKDFPDVKISGKDDFNYNNNKKVKVEPPYGYHFGRTYKSMNLNDESVFDRNYKYFYHKTFDCTKYGEEHHGKKQYNLYNFHNDIDAPNMVLFGDSFTLNLLPSLPSSFKDTLNIYTYASDDYSFPFKIKRFEKYISENHPQVLIITLSEIRRLQYLFDKE